MPVFLAVYAGIVAIPAYFASRAEAEPSVYGIVDAGRVLGVVNDVAAESPALPEEVKRALEASGQGAAAGAAFMESSFVFRPFGGEVEARAALAQRRIKGYFVVPPDYIANGIVDVYTQDSMNIAGGDSRDAFARLMRQRLLNGRVDPRVQERVVSPLAETRRFSVTRTGELTDGSSAAGFVRLVVPLVFMMLFLMSILMTSGYLMQGTATEKENKVVDVLLASADPEQILSGKLLGLGGAGLLQIGVWLMFLLVSGLGVAPLLIAAEVRMPWAALGLAIPLFLLAFLFYGSLMLGTGSLGSNMREAQQLAMVWSLTAAMPLIMMAALIRDPHGVVARVMTLVPFSAAPLIIFRASTDSAGLAWWEIGAGVALLMLSTWIAIRVGARLFRLGLVSASRPGLREILKQARLSP